MSLGEKIKFLRTKNELTQENLAEKLNVSRSAIAKWETNSGVPEVNNLKRISEISELCGWDDVYFFSKQFKKKFGVSPLRFRKNGE